MGQACWALKAGGALAMHEDWSDWSDNYRLLHSYDIVVRSSRPLTPRRSYKSPNLCALRIFNTR